MNVHLCNPVTSDLKTLLFSPSISIILPLQFYLAQILQHPAAGVEQTAPALFAELNEFKKRQEKFERILAEGAEKVKNVQTGGVEYVTICKCSEQ